MNHAPPNSDGGRAAQPGDPEKSRPDSTRPENTSATAASSGESGRGSGPKLRAIAAAASRKKRCRHHNRKSAAGQMKARVSSTTWAV